MSDLHVIFGTGPAGCWTARALLDLGLPVRAVNHTGDRPALLPKEVELHAADLSDRDQAVQAGAGAAVLYQALNPPYNQWHQLFPGLQSSAIAAATASGARYVSIENIYMYDSSRPITETSPVVPRSKKGSLRARMAEEVSDSNRSGAIRATTLRSSDYYGPGVLGSAFGELVFRNLVSGKKAQVGGSADQPHSTAYIEDVGRAAAILGTREEALGEVWLSPHAPAQTQRAMIEAACRNAGTRPQVQVISPLMMRLAGIIMPEARESVEMMYEFTEPFVVDSNKIRNAFGLEATPLEAGIGNTVRWYQENYRGQLGGS
ncbi:MAG TPA: NAD-dependent epimerase/dehydratase family protein [Anaerolineales bacterium]|nr:NAD-dependent epimerase/dehydratase family protein [Anaerolineales bacterium]